MTLFDRRPLRLEDPALIEAAVRTLCMEGFERQDIEEALIRTAPVDLDLLAQCLARVLRTGEQTMSDATKYDMFNRDTSPLASLQSDRTRPVRRAA